MLSGIESRIKNVFLQGIDVSNVALSLAKNNTTATYFNFDISSQLDPSIRKADIVTCCEVLEHIENDEVFVRDMKKLLKDDGVLILTVPSGPRCHYDKHIGHFRHYTQAQLINLFSKHFSKVEVRGLGFPFYNLYRLLRMLRGKKLITDAQRQNANKPSLLLTTVSAMLRFLMDKASCKDSPFAWQLILIAKNGA